MCGTSQLSPLADFLPSSLPLCPSTETLWQLDIYLDMLLDWNKVLNLTGCVNKERLFAELICDSFHLAYFLDKLLPEFSGSIWDAGAGAGLPGIPLRLVWTKGNYTMIEAREKRGLFLANVLAKLKIPRTYAVRERVEKFAIMHKQKAHCAVARAFKPWPELINFFKPYLNGPLIIMANSPPPQLNCTLLAHYSYEAVAKKRWFWAVMP